MPHYSQTSMRRLNSCHPDLMTLFMAVIEDYDCTIICGHRGKAAQEAAFESGNSRVNWPNGKHNRKPSKAVDAAPYFMGHGLDWQDTKAFCYFAGRVMEKARHLKELGLMTHDIRYGGDWDSDGRTLDQTFNDLVHFELI